MVFSQSIHLTKRELEIMNILWDSDTPLVASEIAKRGHNLTINTVQAVLKQLISRQYIEIADIVYSGTVLSRSYRTTLSSDEFEMNKIMDSYKKINKRSNMMSHFVATLLEEEKDPEQLRAEINELESLLNTKKSQLQQKK